MKAQYRIATLSILATLMLGFPKPASAEAGWSKKMQGLYRTLAILMTDITSDARFKDPKNRAAIEKNAKTLSELAHDLKTVGRAPSPDHDPSIKMFSKLFADETGRAYRALKGRNDTYARTLLRGIPGYCIACHTRTRSGPDFAKLPLEPTSLDMSRLERGEFYASTRQFDRALKEFDLVIADQTISKLDPLEWSKAVKYALAIAVRVKQDPEQAKQIAERVTNGRQTPFFMKQDSKQWLASIEDWRREAKSKPTTEEGLYSEAVRLLAAAHAAQKYPADHVGDIFYLRASAAVHDLLQLGPNARHAGEAYLIAGICYENLGAFNIGDVHELYYEACVRTHPRTPLSVGCFKRYQESIYLGYTGSSGTHVPEDVRVKLLELEELTQVPPSPPQG